MKLTPIASNMTEIESGNITVLFSYKTPVAAQVNGKVYQTEHKWSATTTRHINKWLQHHNFTDGERAPQSFFDTLLEVK